MAIAIDIALIVVGIVLLADSTTGHGRWSGAVILGMGAVLLILNVGLAVADRRRKA